MSRFLLAIALLCVSSRLVAGEIPEYLGAVKGTLLTTLVDRADFQFASGEVSRCKKTELTGFTIWGCEEVRGARAEVRAKSGATFTFEASRAIVEFIDVSRRADTILKFTYLGRWKEAAAGGTYETPAELTLLVYRSQPKAVSGSLKLSDHGVFGSVAATQP